MEGKALEKVALACKLLNCHENFTLRPLIAHKRNDIVPAAIRTETRILARLRVASGFVISAIGAGSMLCAAVHADDTGVYIGGNFGRDRSSYDTGLFDQQYQSEAAASGDTLGLTGRSIKRGSYVWWSEVGYYFTPYIALEADYLHLGDLKYRSTGQLNIDGDEKSTSTSGQVTSRGPALALMGRLPLTNSIEIDLRLGDYIGKTVYDNDITINAQSAALDASRTNSSLLAGAGVAYTFAGHWSVQLDYLRVQKTGDSATNGKFSVNLATAGISVTF